MIENAADSHSVSKSGLKASKGSENRRFFHGWKSLFLEYCENSTIHGVKYFGCKRRTLYEKIWWVVIFLISVFGSGWFIQNIYRKWDQSPVIVTSDEKSTPIWKIPFPAVTICPETKAKAKYFGDMYHHYLDMQSNSSDSMTNDSWDQFLALTQVCDPDTMKYLTFNQTIDNKSVSWIKKMSISKHEMLRMCLWRNEDVYCNNIFSETLTEEGICYTFNSLAADALLRLDALHKDYPYVEETRSSTQWTLENGYLEDAEIDTYPFRVFGKGARAGLHITLRLDEKDCDFMCRYPIAGFKVVLHTPCEFPRITNQYIKVQFNQEVFISVKPEMITTSKGLRDYAPHRRQCYFNRERRLKFFKVYTKKNCELECLTEYTLHVCGCVKFSMPHDNQTEICGAGKIVCYNDAQDEFLIQGMSRIVNSTFGCDCLPECTSVHYAAKISQTTFNITDVGLTHKISEDVIGGVQRAWVKIYFKELEFKSSKRSELYGMMDFLANCSGLLGLFMGVSLLSLTEIIYFCSIRPFAILRSFRTRQIRPTMVLPLTVNDNSKENEMQL